MQQDEKARMEDLRVASTQEAAVLDELLALERAALDPYFGESDPSAYVALFADNATYFDPNTGGRLDGAAYRQQFAGYAGQIPPFRYEILNPAVDLRGDTAVFTFNLEMVNPADNTVAGVWNTTEVHCRTDRGWEMERATFAHSDKGFELLSSQMVPIAALTDRPLDDLRR